MAESEGLAAVPTSKIEMNYRLNPGTPGEGLIRTA